MSCSDPIADGLSIIRNGLAIGKSAVNMPHSRIKEGICQVLVDEGYISRFEVLDTQPSKTLQVHLKYGPQGQAVINSIVRVSKPGKRVYRRKADLKPVIGGFGITVISTSKGVLSDRACRDANIGGEILLEIR